MSNLQKYIRPLHEKYRDMGISQIIQDAYDRFGSQMIMTTSFGPSGIVLMDYIRSACPSLEIYFIDTKRHFLETLMLRNKIKSDWGLNIKTIFPSQSEDELDTIISCSDDCCLYRKVMVLDEILRGKTAWLCAIRRDQTEGRKNIRKVEYKNGVIKINPLFDWPSWKIWKYIKDNDLPYNSLLDNGYSSIGCEPCTVKGEYRGASRWPGEDKNECGMHR